jgi:hypothetical protein
MAYLTASLPTFRTGLEHVATTADAFYEYPDGSVQLEGASVYSDLWDNLVPWDQLEEVNHNQCFRGLMPFGAKWYFLWYTADYRKKLGDRGFYIIPGPGPVWSDEVHLDELKVTVPFRRKLSKKAPGQFSGFLARWRDSVSERGMFGEGPVHLVSKELEIYSDRVARFTLDVQGSGQNTLNWLSLCLLDFGYSVCPISGVFYNGENSSDYPGQNFVEAYGELTLQNRFRVPIPAQAGSSVEPATDMKGEEERSMSRVLRNARQHPLVRSDAFRVLVTPKDQWEDLEVHVYFGTPVPPDGQALFQRVVNGWLDMGTFGGWGGKGIDYSRPAEFDKTGECAVFGADMGDSIEARTALAVLVRVLERFSSGLVPIDAVLFGKVD